MKVIALLSWYDEPVPWLAECVASAAKIVDHFVAVDGAYALFPEATRKPTSDPVQAETITRTARGAGLGVTVHTPSGPWWGNEVEKRDFALQLGQTVADPGDWYMVIDADEVVAQAPSDTRQRLADAGEDAGEVMMWERNAQQTVADLVDASQDYRWMLRRFYRAQPDMHCVQAHYVVTAGDRVLCGNPNKHRVEPAFGLPDFVLEHRTRLRSKHRQRQKREYGTQLVELGVERLSPLGVAARAG